MDNPTDADITHACAPLDSHKPPQSFARITITDEPAAGSTQKPEHRIVQVSAVCELPDCECPEPGEQAPDTQEPKSWIGVKLIDVDGMAGAWVSEVLFTSPAWEAGLRESDLITKFGPRTVESAGELVVVVSRARPGEGFELAVVRDGKLIHVAGVLREQGGCLAPLPIGAEEALVITPPSELSGGR